MSRCDICLRTLFTKCHILSSSGRKYFVSVAELFPDAIEANQPRYVEYFTARDTAFQPFLVKAHDKIRSRSPITTCNHPRVELQRSVLSREWYTYTMLEWTIDIRRKKKILHALFDRWINDAFCKGVNLVIKL